jgi:carbonic anhydrase
VKENEMKLLRVVFSALVFLTGLSLCLFAQSADESIKKLEDGNKRYIESKPTHQNQTSTRRTEVANGQKPFAVIVTCSDSRVPPEILFDHGIGDLFVIRTAGNILDDIGLGSIEYAVEHLHVPLVVVLGHERCGAVSAAVEGGNAPGHIKALVSNIKRAVEKARSKKGDLLENSIKQNVENVVAQISKSKPILDELVHEKKIKVIGARYDLDDGAVSFFKTDSH